MLTTFSETQTGYGDISAAELLDNECHRLKCTYTRMARMCGLPIYKVSQVASGILKIRPPIAVALEKGTGIPAIDWLYVQARHSLREYYEQKERDGQTS